MQTTTDPVMQEITEAVQLAHAGDSATARDRLLAVWRELGPTGDALHRCSLAHYLADLYEDPAEALVWDVRALDAADSLTDARAQQHTAGLQVAAFYPSLHLNLADNFRRLGSFAAAADQLAQARERLDALPDDEYGQLIGRIITEVAEAVEERSTTRRPSAPGVSG
ncbi:hypothetical protein FB561_2255 [Kribbella amoyensis]|uniref:Tetratricopeptide repeat protein n=1 Tax=Kribbella amoyensis TaxID=996641 RepID=A0A561BQM4_9ACTN|nr:hypothetical protein [Kribbella amoyensis]TWD81151.1 hypothetical protein FB561_2255 [Kribbella amoyensis]